MKKTHTKQTQKEKDKKEPNHVTAMTSGTFSLSNTKRHQRNMRRAVQECCREIAFVFHTWCTTSWEGKEEERKKTQKNREIAKA